MAGEKMHWGESRLFQSAMQVARIRLPKGGRFVVFMKDDSPFIVPIDDPGTYEIDMVKLKKDAAFPVLLTIVRAKDVAMFESMTPDRATSILSAAVTAATAPGTIHKAH